MNHLLHSPPFPYRNIVVRKAAGSTLYDISGRKIIDMTSGFGVAALGYSNHCILKAIEKQLNNISHAIPSLIHFENENASSDSIVSSLGMMDAGVVITTSGSEAIEVALKAATIATGRAGVIVLSGGYHGQSIGTLRVNTHRCFTSPLWSLVGEQALILPYPEPDTIGSTESKDARQSLQLLKRWLFSEEDGSRPIGALLIEPMQNIAGYRGFSSHFASALTELCQKAGVMLISDEVFTGFGRCGDWIISNRVGLTPDIICVGKALTGGVPGGACVARQSLLKPLFPSNSPPLHAPTFYNSPIVNAAMAASIEFIKRESLIERSKIIGETIRGRLAAYGGHAPGFIGVRGMGAAQALVFQDVHGYSDASQIVIHLTEHLLNLGVFALNSGFPRGDVVTLCPPLVITDSELDFALSALEKALDQLAKEMT